MPDVAKFLVESQRYNQSALEKFWDFANRLDVEDDGRKILICHISSLLNIEEPDMLDLQVRPLEAQQGLLILRPLNGDQPDPLVAEAKATSRQNLSRVKPTRPFTDVFHGRVDDENDGPIEGFLPCPDLVTPSEVVDIRTEPAHDGAFIHIAKAQWDCPVILAA